MKYNRIDIKMWIVSTSFKINIEIPPYIYITYTIFNYNSISPRCSFFPVPVKGLYQTASYSLHVMELVRIFILQWQHLPTNIACPIFLGYWSVINRTYKCKLRPHRGILFSNTYTKLFQIVLSSSSKRLITI